MMEHIARIGLIGCGRLAERGYVPAISQVDAMRLVAVADPDVARRNLVAGLASSSSPEAPPATFADARSMLEGADLDAVVVASPAAAHLEDARCATAAGVAVLVEKPPAPDVAGAEALAHLTPGVWVGFNRRFDPGARAVRAHMPDAGAVELDLEIAYRRQSWKALTVHDDALLDLGPHLVDWARWITSSEVLAVGEAAVTPDRASWLSTLACGRARIVAATDRPYRELVELRGHDRRRIARHALGGPVAAIRDRVLRGAHPLITSLAGQLAALADVVRGTPSADLATARDAAPVMAVIAAVRVSAAAGGTWVEVPRPSIRSTRVL